MAFPPPVKLLAWDQTRQIALLTHLYLYFLYTFGEYIPSPHFKNLIGIFPQLESIYAFLARILSDVCFLYSHLHITDEGKF